MSSLSGRGDFLTAGASWNTAGPNVARYNRNCVAARTGVGTYTVTLDQPLNAGECFCLAQPRTGAGNSNAQIAHTSDTVKTITTFVGAVATDMDWDFVAGKVLAGGA